jgi:hypothetical protein
MKNFFWIGILAAAAFYAYSSWPGSPEHVASKQAAAPARMGNPVREIERAPKTLLEMQDAMGSSNAGVAHAARDAVSRTVGR